MLALCLTVSIVLAQPRGKGGEKPRGGEPHKAGEKPRGENKGGNKPPGGAWSEGKSPAGNEGHHPGAAGKPNAAGAGAPGAANKLKPNQTTGKEGAAAGAAAANRNNPNATGKEGAAVGAAAANKNKPNATGAQGAAAGAAAANRNNPNATGAQGAAVGAAAANRNQPHATGAAGAAAGYAAVRNNFDHPNVYNADWYAAHQGAWSANNWAAGSAWTAASMAAVATHCNYANSTPVSYGYGNNVMYQNGNVIVDGQSVGTGEEFSQQAADLALAGHNAELADTDEWLPLGVFALVRDENQHPQLTLQLAINQQGILRGNYTDVISDLPQPIQGSVDKETQRAAWSINGNQSSFMEAGLKNLTDGEAPTLLHKNGKTEKWLLVRLDQPEGSDKPDAGTEN